MARLLLSYWMPSVQANIGRMVRLQALVWQATVCRWSEVYMALQGYLTHQRQSSTRSS